MGQVDGAPITYLERASPLWPDTGGQRSLNGVQGRDMSGSTGEAFEFSAFSPSGADAGAGGRRAEVVTFTGGNTTVAGGNHQIVLHASQAFGTVGQYRPMTPSRNASSG